MKIFIRIFLALALTAGVFAQQPAKNANDQPPKKDSPEPRELVQDNFYRLAFSIYELQDGKRSNQRDYMMIAKTNNSGGSTMRVSTRVPIYTEENKMQYIDVGLNLRCPVKELAGNKLQAECDIEISNFVRPEQYTGSGGGGTSAPVLRTTRSSSWALLTLGKPAIMTTLDDVNSTKRIQVEVTATKME
jgi:hypothetical protein